MQIGSVERQAPTAQMSNEAPHPLERFGLSSLVTQPLLELALLTLRAPLRE